MTLIKNHKVVSTMLSSNMFNECSSPYNFQFNSNNSHALRVKVSTLCSSGSLERRSQALIIACGDNGILFDIPFCLHNNLNINAYKK